MSDIGKTALKTKIDNKVYENSSQAITGTIMNEVLQDVVDTLADGGNLDAGSVDTANIKDGAVTDGKLDTGVLNKVDWATASQSYYRNSQAGNVAAKTLTTYTDGYVMRGGGSLKVTFENANTADNATLNIDGKGAKPLYYNGVRVSSTNSWAAGETVEIYYNNYNSGIFYAKKWQTDVVSVSQNTETGHTDISVGGVTTPVASLIDYEKAITYNHSNPADELDGYAFDNMGGVFAIEGRKISGYIHCSDLSYLWELGALAAGFYDSNKEWLSGQYVNEFDDGKFAVPDGAFYVRITGFSASNFGIFYEQNHTYYAYGVTKKDSIQDAEILELQNKVEGIEGLDLEWLRNFNKENPADELDGYAFDNMGGVFAIEGFKISGYVKCVGKSKIWQIGANAAGFYNENKEWISGSYVNTFPNDEVTVPEGAYYVRTRGISANNFAIYLEEAHSYIPYGYSTLTETIERIEDEIKSSGGGGANISGYEVDSVSGMDISLKAGIINGVESNATQITIPSPLSANKTVTMDILTSDTVISDIYGYPCPCEVLSVVKNGVTLVEGTDYSWAVRTAVLSWRKTTAIKSLTGSTISGATVNIRFDYSRIDRIVVNKNTGVVSLKKGYENNTLSYDNPTLTFLTPVENNEKVLYNVFVRWSATSILIDDVKTVKQYNEFGYKDEEYNLIGTVKKDKASSIYPFYTQLAFKNLRVEPLNTPLNAQSRILRIGFIGDSRTDSEQAENIHNGIYYGYPFTFGRTIASILGVGTKTYMQSHISCQKILRDTQGDGTYIEVVNYGKGGNMIQEWMHSYYGYYDRPTSANDGLISLMSYNGENNIHDLVFLNVTNPIFGCLELIDSQCPNNLYKNDYSDNGYSLLYDIATRPIAQGGHYALSLHSQSEYGDGSTETQRKYLLEDMSKVYLAMYQRIIDTLKSQNPNVQIVILFGLPDAIGVFADNPIHYETSPETNRLMFDLAKSNNLPFMNLSYLFFGCEKRLGLNKLLTEYPEGNIHPSPYLHYVIGNVLTEYISNEII